MNLIKAIAPLLAQGVTLKLILTGDADSVRFDLVPEAKENKLGINLPLTSVVASPAEMDDQLEQFFQTYVAGATRVTGIAETAAVAIAAAEEEAKSIAASKVAAAKGKTTTSTPKRLPAPAAKGPRTGGLPDDEDDGLGEGDDNGGTTLETSGAASVAAPAPDAPPADTSVGDKQKGDVLPLETFF